MSGALIFKNSIWNMVGQVVPLAVAFISIPLLIKGIGADRFGILTLSWMITGYFNLFDLGLGRALTQLISEKLAKNEPAEVPAIIQTVILLMFGLGVFAALILVVGSPYAIDHLVKVPDELKGEAIASSWIAAATIPLVIATSALKGAIEATHRFDIVNLIRIPMGTLSYLMPILILPFSHELPPIMIGVLLIRFLGYLVHYIYCKKLFPALKMFRPLKKGLVRPLFSFGSWMTVSNIISPIMVQMDRFYIGSVVSLTAVTYYTTPYEMITKLWLIPLSLVAVLFPTLAKAIVVDMGQAILLYRRSCAYLFIVVAPIVFVLNLFSKEILWLWINREFSDHSYIVMQVLAFGILINAVANVPFTLLQSAARPDVTAKVHMLELPFYLLVIWYLTKNFGINGAAMAWTIRVTADALMLGYCADHFVFKSISNFKLAKIIPWFLAVAVVFYLVLWATEHLSWMERIPLAILGLGIYTFWSFRIIHEEDRHKILNYIRKVTQRSAL